MDEWMPYSKAHYFILFILVVTFIGFWPSYFNQLSAAPLAFHVHGIIAVLWMVLMVFQSWSIHSRKRSWHRTVGLLSLILLPLLTGSLVMIANVSAAGFYAKDPYYQVIGAHFGYATLIPFLAYLFFYSQALRYRRNVHLHSGFMLATAFFMWEPAFARILIRFVPAFEIAGVEDLSNGVDAIAAAIVLPLIFAVYLTLRKPKHGQPMLLVSLFLAAQITGLFLIAPTDWWQGLFMQYAGLPNWLTVSVGVALGVLATVYGWYGRVKPDLHRKSE